MWVGVSPALRQLQQRLLADDRLVQQHVVEHAAERVAHRRGPAPRPRRPRRSRCPASRCSWPGPRRAVRPASVRSRRRAVHLAAERLDHQAAVGLAVVRRPDLPHLALEVVERAREGQRRAPLAGPGLRGQLLHAGLLVVVRLRHRGVRLVRPGRRDALVLVVDARRRAERLLEAVRAEQRRRAATGGRRRARRRGSRRTAPARPPAGSAPSGTAARSPRGRRAAGCRGAAPAAAGSAGPARCCTRASASRPRRARTCAGEPCRPSSRIPSRRVRGCPRPRARHAIRGRPRARGIRRDWAPVQRLSGAAGRRSGLGRPRGRRCCAAVRRRPPPRA